jgi:predicted RNA-binding protein with PIN domain
MKLLIDGYNLMHAVNLPPAKVGPDALRKLRQRFLNELAHALGPLEASQTVVVFDAAEPPKNLPRETRHKGMTVLFAAGDEDADARMESLIAKHSAPKGLVVVSSDHRVQRAALRRKAKAIGADDFWTKIHNRSKQPPVPDPARDAPGKNPVLSAEESAYWQEAFRDVVEDSQTREALRGADFVPTDEEIARIKREVDDEA